MGRIKDHEKGKSNLHAEVKLSEKLESRNLDPPLSKLIQTYQYIFARSSNRRSEILARVGNGILQWVPGLYLQAIGFC